MNIRSEKSKRRLKIEAVDTLIAIETTIERLAVQSNEHSRKEVYTDSSQTNTSLKVYKGYTEKH